MKKPFVPLVLVLCMLVLAVPAYALQIEPPAVPTISTAWAIFIALVGWPAFKVPFLNILKLIHVLPDGAADATSFILDILAFGVVAYLTFTGKLDLLSSIDGGLLGLSKILVDIVIILGGFGGAVKSTSLFHGAYKGLRVVGYSHSLAKAK